MARYQDPDEFTPVDDDDEGFSLVDDDDDFQEVDEDDGHRWGDWVGAGVRGVGGFLGNAPLVGAAFAGGGDLIGQTFEKFGGSRKRYNPLQTATEAGIGALGFFGKAGRLGWRIAKGAGLASLGSTANDATQQIDRIAHGEQDGWDTDRSASAATFGGVIGAGGAGAAAGLSKLLKRAPMHGPNPETIRETAERVNPFGRLETDVDQGMPALGRPALDPAGANPGNVATPPRVPWAAAKRGKVTRRAQVEGIEPGAIIDRPEPTLTPFKGADEGYELVGAKQPAMDFEAPRTTPDYGEFEATQHRRTLDSMKDLTDMLARRGKYAPATPHVDLDPELPAPTAPSRTINGSGESSASVEAMNRARGMKDRGEEFVVFDRAGNERPASYRGDPDAVDYFPREGETTAVRKADGTLEIRDDRGGKVPSSDAPPPSRRVEQVETDGPRLDLGEPRPPKLKIPAEVHALHESLKPKWAEGGNPEDLLPFARRMLSEPNERKLMWGERKARRAATARTPDVVDAWKGTGSDRHSVLGQKDAGAFPAKSDVSDDASLESMVSKIFGDEGGGGPDALTRFGDESGNIDPRVLTHLLGAGAGATLGAATSDDENKVKNAIGYGLLGGATPLAFQKGGLDKLAQLRYFSMLGSTSAQAKNIVGNAGAAIVRAAEEAATGNSDTAKSILKEVFSTETGRRFIDAFKQAPEGDTRWGRNSGVLGTFSRVMHAVDESVTEGMKRGGLPEDEAKLSLFTSEPKSEFGKWVASRPSSGNAVMPFVRTAVNVAERGLEHTPGVGLLPAVRGMRDSSDKQVTARQLMGLLALAAGAGTGTDNPYLGAALGPLAVPFAAGAAGKEAWDKKGDSLTNLTKAELDLLRKILPLPTESYAWEPSRFLASFVPGVVKDATQPGAQPKDFETSGNLFDPAIAKVPILNESLLRKKRKRRREGR